MSSKKVGLAQWEGLPSPYYTDKHQRFRVYCRNFVDKEVLPNIDKWWESMIMLGLFIMTIIFSILTTNSFILAMLICTLLLFNFTALIYTPDIIHMAFLKIIFVVIHISMQVIFAYTIPPNYSDFFSVWKIYINAAIPFFTIMELLITQSKWKITFSIIAIILLTIQASLTPRNNYHYISLISQSIVAITVIYQEIKKIKKY